MPIDEEKRRSQLGNLMTGFREANRVSDSGLGEFISRTVSTRTRPAITEQPPEWLINADASTLARARLGDPMGLADWVFPFTGGMPGAQRRKASFLQAILEQRSRERAERAGQAAQERIEAAKLPVETFKAETGRITGIAQTGLYRAQAKEATAQALLKTEEAKLYPKVVAGELDERSAHAYYMRTMPGIELEKAKYQVDKLIAEGKTTEATELQRSSRTFISDYLKNVGKVLADEAFYEKGWFGGGPKKLNPAGQEALKTLHDDLVGALSTLGGGESAAGPTGGPTWEEFFAEAEKRGTRMKPDKLKEYYNKFYGGR